MDSGQACNVGQEFSRFYINNHQVIAARDIKIARRRVHIEIIKAAFAAQRHGFYDMIAGRCSQSGDRHQRRPKDRCENPP